MAALKRKCIANILLLRPRRIPQTSVSMWAPPCATQGHCSPVSWLATDGGFVVSQALQSDDETYPINNFDISFWVVAVFFLPKAAESRQSVEFGGD